MKYGSSAAASGKTWEPSVLYLLGLVIAEIIIMGALRTVTKHGG
jgi:hypothetical protein